MTRGPGFQVAIGQWLSRQFEQLQHWLAPVPEPLLGLVVAARPAPDFTLTDTNGAVVRLADHRGHNVVLYFSEGAGCRSCLYQMADIERNATH